MPFDAIELSSVAIGGRVLSVSDEFFAEAYHLLLVEPAISLKGQFGPNGALYSGWETRRHNPDHDWCIIQLGTPGSIIGFDIDTSHFNGNEAPRASVDAFRGDTDEFPSKDDSRWKELLAPVDLGPNVHHLLPIPRSEPVNFVKLKMYPDGGIARFRVYGHVVPVIPQDATHVFDLAHVFAGGSVVETSDQHFGVGSNLVLPGRGKDMGDGWETKRSRQKGHKDWAIIKLGIPGYLQYMEIDTAHFKGNFPESCEAHASLDSKEWTLVLPRTKLGPHRQHYFQLENVEGQPFTHVRVTIHPDGGMKRVRVMGSRSPSVPAMSTPNPINTATPTSTVPVLPLTPEAFAPFGKVIQAYQDHAAVPKGTKITPANGGTATKFHKLALLENRYPNTLDATTGLSVYRCKPINVHDGKINVNVMERHRYTNQAFIPMSSTNGTGYLVIVANGGDTPDMKTLRAFLARPGQGIVYDTAVWHQPMTVLGDQDVDFTCVETQVGNGGTEDCEIVELEGDDVVSLRL
ncbi:galactose-binding domain-like protein [Armillaria nabsnona]|nr:galactose-binding domain-like protein [Armillaria nabsnona]